MEILIEELKKCIEEEMFFTALNTSLIIPDICSALQSENGQTNGTKYKNWFDTYCAEKYDGNVSGEDIYKIRCALLHQGKLNHDNPNFERILFQVPTNRGFVLHNNTINGALNLNLKIFIEDIISGYELWHTEQKENVDVIKNKNKSIQYYPNGLPPYIVGLPLIC